MTNEELLQRIAQASLDHLDAGNRLALAWYKVKTGGFRPRVYDAALEKYGRTRRQLDVYIQDARKRGLLSEPTT